ncbi:MAG: hypothetical protein R2824_24130 [Saprospiraceae bacterium]
MAEKTKNSRLQELHSLICELGELRKGIPQFLFKDQIFRAQLVEFREKILNFRKASSNHEVEEIDFILQSPGGEPDKAFKIIRTLRNNFKVVNIIVPYWAKSAATLLALGGNTIVMDEFAEFGPIDIQIPKQKDDRPQDDEWESVLIDEASLDRIETRARIFFNQMFVNIFQDERIPVDKNTLIQYLTNLITSFYEPLVNQIDPYKIGEKRRALDICQYYAWIILNRYQPEISGNDKERLIQFLLESCPDHGVVVDYDLIRTVLKNVKYSMDLVPKPAYGYKLSEITSHLLSDNISYSFIGFVDKNLLSLSVNDSVTTKNLSSVKKQKPRK